MYGHITSVRNKYNKFIQKLKDSDENKVKSVKRI